MLVASFGHTHVPTIFRRDADGSVRGEVAVGDGDEGSVTWRRVEYPLERAQEKIRAAGLPELLAARLAAGR